VIGKALGRLALVGAACVGYGFWEARHFVIRRQYVPILPPGSAPLRLLHVSDIHLMARQTYKTDFLRALAGLEPERVSRLDLRGPQHCHGQASGIEPHRQHVFVVVELPVHQRERRGIRNHLA
jgi:hypothetical protein